MDIESFEQGIIKSYKCFGGSSGYYEGARLSKGYLKHAGLPDVEYVVDIDLVSGEIHVTAEGGHGNNRQEQYRGRVTISYIDGVK